MFASSDAAVVEHCCHSLSSLLSNVDKTLCDNCSGSTLSSILNFASSGLNNELLARSRKVSFIAAGFPDWLINQASCS
jgi:hypothetical protein